jgi:threonine/homoserine/homoserine lactone efflux protein
MSLENWFLFLTTVTVLCIAPGPAVLLVVSLSLSSGFRAGLTASLGILSANVPYFLLSATSLGAILAASAQLFSVIRWLGAAYLIWLGVRMFQSASFENTQPDRSSALPAHSSPFLLGFLTQGANPGALLFFTALLPQFIDTNFPIGFQVFVLGVSSSVIELLVLGLYAATCHTARVWSHRPGIFLWLQRVGGLVLVGAGVSLAAIRLG